MMYIPPTPNKKNLKNPQSVSRYIQKFFNVIIRRKILRTSTLIQDFLTSDNIETYKKGIKEFKLAPNMENYKSNKESLKFDFKEEQLYLPLNYFVLYNSYFSEYYLPFENCSSFDYYLSIVALQKKKY